MYFPVIFQYLIENLAENDKLIFFEYFFQILSGSTFHMKEFMVPFTYLTDTGGYLGFREFLCLVFRGDVGAPVPVDVLALQ